MTIQEAARQIHDQLIPIYQEGEAAAISNWVIEHLTCFKQSDRIIQKKKKMTAEQEDRLNEYIKRLLLHEPVQYVLNESWFCGLKFYVDKNVLIPRPETEELVGWVISGCKPRLPAGRFPVSQLSILDIGTGSGSIPIAIKRRLRSADVWSCDISEGALQVARKNATNLGAEVNFSQLDFLNEEKRNQLPSFDIIISNPPYIPEKDKKTMQPNVVSYEPHSALFVPDADPILFYKAIASFGKNHLNTDGAIYTEIHEAIGEAVYNLFKSQGYTTELKKDMQGKERMMKAVYGF